MQFSTGISSHYFYLTIICLKRMWCSLITFSIPGIILHFSNFTFLDWLICDDQIYSSWIPLYFRNTSWSNQILYFCLGALGSFIHGSTLHLSQKPEFEGVRTFGPRLLAPVETDINDIFTCMISPLELQEYMSVCT